MVVSSDLITEFAKVTNDKKEKSNETSAYGIIVEHNNSLYVRMDGSDQLTPVIQSDVASGITGNSTSILGNGDRVMVTIKNHVATVTGNTTDPAPRIGDVKSAIDASAKIDEFEIILADKVSTAQLEAEKARITVLETDNATINNQLSATKADINTLQANDVTINKTLTANQASITELQTGKLDADTAKVTYATIKNLEATNADLENLESTYGNFVNLTTENFAAVTASIQDLEAGSITTDQLDAKYATIITLDAEKARITDLEAEVGDIDTLIFGSATGSTIQTSFANAVIAQLGNAQIKSAMIENISASKIATGDIITNNITVKSEDGKLLISDETIQISDETRVRVQIGKDSAGDYSINIWDTDGNLMFSEGGITDSAIKDAIIRNDMVSDTANIAAHKLDINSLFEEINDSEKTIKSTRIYLDDKAQTLDVAFESVTTDIKEIQNGMTSQGTQITAMQGQIASKIWQQDIDTAINDIGETTDNLSSQYEEIQQDLNGMSATVANHTSVLESKADSTTVTEVSDRVASIETSLNGFQSTVSNTYATKTEVSNIEVGARNLLLNTGNNKLPVMSNGATMIANGTDSVTSANGVMTMNCNTSTREIYYRFMTPASSSSNLYGLEFNKSYTFSGKVQATTTSGTLDKLVVRIQIYNPSTGWADIVSKVITDTDTSDWVNFVSTFIIPETADGIYVSFQLYYTDSWVGTILAKTLQLEKGNKATDWAPAPEDYPTVESVATAQSTAEVAQNSVDSLEVGSRNLLLNSKVFTGSNITGPAILDSETYNNFNVRMYDATTLENVYSDIITFGDLYAEELGSTYTLSFYAKGNGAVRMCTYFYGGTDYVRVAKIVQSNGTSSTAADGAAYWTLTEDWQRYWVRWTLRDEGDVNIVRYVMFRLWSGATAYICGCKLEKGDKATDWTPAPEDVDGDIATAQAAAEAAQASANQNAADMANIVTTFNSDIANLQTQIDGSITTWFYEVAPTSDNEPAVNWTTTDLKNTHLGDLYYDTVTGYCYRYQVQNNTYSWQRITDTDVTKALADAQTAQDTADQKRRVFYTQPTVPYDTGDLWVQGSSGDILRCQTAKVTGQSYSVSDWVAASKYTDDTTANNAIEKANIAQQTADTAQDDINNLRIGGRNLLFNSKGDDVTNWCYPPTVVEDDVKGHCVQRTNTTPSGENYIGSTRTGIVEPSTEYTFSADMWCNEYLRNYDLFWLSDTYDDIKTGSGYVNIVVNSIKKIPANTWTRVSWTFTTNADDRTGFIRIDNNGTSEEGTAAILRVANMKLEKGNRATDWTPAPEDLENRVSTAETKILQNENSISTIATRTTTVENKFAGYSTTEQMNSAIDQSASNITASVSENYTSKTEFKSLEIGGRNLVAGTSLTTVYSGNVNDGDGSYKDVWTAKTIDIPTGTEYIVSFDAKADVAQTIRCHFYSPNTTTSSLSSTGQSSKSGDGVCDVTITTEWARYWVKWTQTPADTTKSIIVGRNLTENDIHIRAVKFEAGNKATDWSPAPEDMATGTELSSVESRVATAESKITQNANNISSVVSRTTANETDISTLEQTADGLTLRLDNAEKNITNAAKTATNYIDASSSGLVVGNMTTATLGKNVLIDSDSVDIRNGSTVLASFGADKVTLGQNSADSIIDLCDGAGTISAQISEASTSYPEYDSILIASQEINTSSQRFVTDVTNSYGVEETPTYQNDGEIYMLSYQSSAGSYARMTGHCKTTSTGDMTQTGVSAAALNTPGSTSTSVYAEFWDESAGSWTQSNQVKVYPTKTTASKPIWIQGTAFTGENKVLWSGGYYMSDTQTATLSEAISAQANGVVLVWSYYTNGATDNSNFQMTYIPKHFITLHLGKGVSAVMTNGTMNIMASKYVYVSDTTIKGYAGNDDAATAKDSGVTSTAKYFVLRYVIGV
ncbi:MAG: hypothetical protein J6B01_04660 [Ruminococcus sp.]|nr:hypothetical protein [Ruminococcus sp.]